MKPHLTCTALRKAFDGIIALQDVSLAVASGTVLGLTGPNGSGKSTLLNVLTGIIRPDAGVCELDGEPLTGERPNRVARRGIGRTFQDPRVVARLTVAENIALSVPDGTEHLVGALFRRSRSTASVLRWASEVGLERVADAPANQLSYGQRKLLSVAVCLARGPRVVLMDEPIAGLQDPWRAHVLALIRSCAATGAIVIVVEHDLEAIRAIATRVVVLRQGRIVQEIAPSDLTADRLFAAYAG